MIKIPTEGDFLSTPDLVDEALENNRRNGLPAKKPTEIRRKQPDGTVLVWSSTTPACAAAWVDDMILVIGLMCFEAEIESWEQDNDRQLNILNKYFPSEYQRVSEALWDARENVSNLRW